MKDRLIVSINTVSNGYTLDLVKGERAQGYMYFNLMELLQGFMYHVGLQEPSPYVKTEISAFLQAVSKWQDNEMNVKELIRREEEIALLKENCSWLENQLAQKKQQNERLKDRKKVLQKKLAQYEKK